MEVVSNVPSLSRERASRYAPPSRLACPRTSLQRAESAANAPSFSMAELMSALLTAAADRVTWSYKGQVTKGHTGVWSHHCHILIYTTALSAHLEV